MTRIDVGGFALRGSHRIARGGDGHLGQDGKLVVRPFGNARAHDVRIEHTRLVHDVAALDAGRLDDELDGGFLTAPATEPAAIAASCDAL